MLHHKYDSSIFIFFLFSFLFETITLNQSTIFSNVIDQLIIRKLPQFSIHQQNNTFVPNHQKIKQLSISGKLYRISLLWQPGTYLTFEQPNLLIHQYWHNGQQQYFYLQNIQNNKYRIINAKTKRPLILKQSFNQSYIIFSEEIVKISQNQSFQISSDQKENQKRLNKVNQIWTLNPDNDSKQGYLISGYNGYQLTNIPIRYLYRYQLVKQVYFSKKQKVLLIRQIKQNQISEEQLQDQIASLYKNLTYGFFQSPFEYQKWSYFYQLAYDYLELKKQFPKWLDRYGLSAYPYDLPLTNKENLIPYEIRKILSHQQKILKSNVSVHCAKSHLITYIWMGTKKMPPEYQKIITNCKQNAQVINQKHFENYIDRWNSIYPDYKLFPSNYPVRKHMDLLKLLYLYFEGGMYADFDVQINQQCFADIKTNEVIFTNKIAQISTTQFHWIPEESFLKVDVKEHPQIKRMLIAEIKKQDRWLQCRQRQCLIVQCQRHLNDRTYYKGYQ